MSAAFRTLLLPLLACEKPRGLEPDAVLAGGFLAQGASTPTRDAAVRMGLASRGTSVQSLLERLSLPCPAGGANLGDTFVLAGGCAGQGASTLMDVVELSGILGVGPTLPVSLESCCRGPVRRPHTWVPGGREALPDGRLTPSSRAFLPERAGAVVRVRELAPMDVPRAPPRAVRAGNGWVYVEDGAGAATGGFDPSSERFTLSVPLPESRTGHSLAGAPEGRVSLVGGAGPDEA